MIAGVLGVTGLVSTMTLWHIEKRENDKDQVC